MIDERKKALRMYRFWRNRLEDLGVNVNGVNAKEDEKGKETFPPAPPIEKREKEKKSSSSSYTRARAREKFAPPSRESVVKYATSKKIPSLFVDYWLDCMCTNYSPPWFDCIRQVYIVEWRRSLLCYWSKADNDKAWFEFKCEHENANRAKGRTYTETDWTLCAERCANCDGTHCRRGIATPPAESNPPHPPEECPKFQPLPSTI